MITKKKILTVLLFFWIVAFLLSFSLSAQDTGPLPSKVSTILAKFPASSSTDRDQFAAELVSLGPGGIQEVCRRLAAPGTDDDSLARFAVDSMAVYVTRPSAWLQLPHP